jgi:hypothetical protein
MSNFSYSGFMKIINKILELNPLRGCHGINVNTSDGTGDIGIAALRACFQQ